MFAASEVWVGGGRQETMDGLRMRNSVCSLWVDFDDNLPFLHHAGGPGGVDFALVDGNRLPKVIGMHPPTFSHTHTLPHSVNVHTSTLPDAADCAGPAL